MDVAVQVVPLSVVLAPSQIDSSFATRAIADIAPTLVALPTDTETRTVVLHRKNKTGFGFSIIGGGACPVTVSKITVGSVAAQSGQIFLGDQV